MIIDFEVHGVLSFGHTIWNKKSDYAKKFYSSDEIRGGGNSAFFIEINRDLTGYKTFYTYIINNVYASSNRSGSYFGITISTDALYTDIRLVYAALDSIFNKMVLGKILTKLSTGGFKYICDRDFSEAESDLQKMEQTFLRVIEVASTPSDILNIPATFNKANKRLTIDAANLSNGLINEQLLKGLTIVAIPNLDAARIQDLEKKLTLAESQLSNSSQQLAAANNKCTAMERLCNELKQKVTILDAKARNVPPVQTSIKDLEKLVEDAKTIIYDFNKFVNSKIPKKSGTHTSHNAPQPSENPEDQTNQKTTSFFRKFFPILVLVLLSATCFSSVYSAIANTNDIPTEITPTDTTQSSNNEVATTQTDLLQLTLDPKWKIDIPELKNKTIKPNSNFTFDLVEATYDGSTSSTRKTHKDPASIKWIIIENNIVKHNTNNNNFKAPENGYLNIIAILGNKIIAMRAIGIGYYSNLSITEGFEPYPYYIAEYNDPINEPYDYLDMDNYVYSSEEDDEYESCEEDDEE